MNSSLGKRNLTEKIRIELLQERVKLQVFRLGKRSLTGKLRIEYKSFDDPRKELDGQTPNLTKDLDSARTILGGKESEITDLQRRSHTRHSEPAEIKHPILFKMEISPAKKSADSFCMAEGAG